MGKIRVGVSGWRYRHWRDGAFYPPGLPQRRELEFVARHLSTVEINGSFYSLLRPATYADYFAQVPAGFVFAVKGGQFITHAKKLLDVDVALANFFASGVLRLEQKLGPILWQLPARRLPVERVDDFLELLPGDTVAAARLARRHDHRVAGRASFGVDRSRTLRHALEVRHPDMLTDSLVRACRRRNVALVFSHNSGEWPYVEEVTAGWCYVRLHGAPDTYASDYPAAELRRWAERVGAWWSGREPADAPRISRLRAPRRTSRDVYVYFDNDQGAHAPRNAIALGRLIPASAPAARSSDRR